MDKFLINGIDISEFEIINKSLIGDISVFINRIYEALGTRPAVSGEMLDGKHYIVIDGTELIADKYSITLENGNTIIKGSAHSLPSAMDVFIDICLKRISEKSYSLSASDNFEGSTGKKQIYTKDQLIAVIEKVYADPNHVIIGEQVCGNPKGADNVAESIELFKTATGQMPGIMGIDLACYGLDLPGTDDATWSSYICDIVDYASDGGIITASAHWANPSGNYTDAYNACRGLLGYDNSRVSYQKAFTDLLTAGTEYNEAFMGELEAEARFLKALDDNGVSIIWRPLHEANGNWFWFCLNSYGFDAKYIIDIWHYVYEYFTEECGLDNLIWCYAPNVSTIESEMSVYPGDEYCDMVGIDWYTSGEQEIAKNDNYLKFTEFTGKPGAITEFGTSGAVHAENEEDQIDLYNCMDVYRTLCRFKNSGYSFVYLLTWYNRWDITHLTRGSELMATDMALSQKDVRALLDELR